MQELLSYIHDNNIANVVSISSDVHFAAHVSMSPERAEGNFSNFKQLEEFLIGPIHGGAFGPNYMDTSFGAAYEFGECSRSAFSITTFIQPNRHLSDSDSSFNARCRTRPVDVGI